MEESNNAKSYKELYYKHYKKLFFIPMIILALALVFLVVNYINTGDIIEKDVSLKGGITATLYTSEEFPELEYKLKEIYPQQDIIIRELTQFGSNEHIGVAIEISEINDQEFRANLQEITGIEITQENFSIEVVGSSLGENFYRQMMIAMLLAFVFMAIVVFITFRVWVPSLAVVFAAFSDIVITMAIINIIGLRLSTAGIAALLLLIGYSIDTDILLTTRVLKKSEGTIYDSLVSSIKTGLTMTITTIAALGVGYFITNSFVLKQMFIIIIIGLLVDVISTYCVNAGLLVWYAKRKHGLE